MPTFPLSLAMAAPDSSVLVIGGGPAGLRAAETASASGTRVILCDAQPSVGRKFLVAGRGGLNLTHSEPVENFPARYRTETARWKDLLGEFSPDDLGKWAHDLEVETYVGSSGRVFPKGQKAAGLLRAWVRRLRERRVDFRVGLQLKSLNVDAPKRVPPEGPASAGPVSESIWCAKMETSSKEMVSLSARAIVLALGGASWPGTGSDGAWPAILLEHGVEITPWAAANCGWEVAWPARFLERAEGLPLKNLTVSAGGEQISGELLITRYGLEGGAIYRLGPILREMARPEIEVDLKPQLTADALRTRLAGVSPDHWLGAMKVSPAAQALLDNYYPDDQLEADRIVSRLKQFTLPLLGPRPIAEAISSAGGIRWEELDDMLMLRKMPGVFVAGEMIDWEAPTGGYLLQGCFSTGTRAGGAAAKFAQTA